MYHEFMPLVQQWGLDDSIVLPVVNTSEHKSLRIALQVSRLVMKCGLIYYIESCNKHKNKKSMFLKKQQVVKQNTNFLFWLSVGLRNIIISGTINEAAYLYIVFFHLIQVYGAKSD